MLTSTLVQRTCTLPVSYKNICTLFLPLFVCLFCCKLMLKQDDLKTALQNQRSLLEEEKRLALDILREEVVHMEEKHRKALQELQNLHEAEIKKHKEEHSRQLEEELEKLKAQHEHEQEVRMLVKPQPQISHSFTQNKFHLINFRSKLTYPDAFLDFLQ